MEYHFGPEDQELLTDALENWEKLSRSRGQAIRDFLIDFDLKLGDAQARGYAVGAVALSRELLKKSRLTDEEKRYVGQPNFSRFCTARGATVSSPARGRAG